MIFYSDSFFKCRIPSFCSMNQFRRPHDIYSDLLGLFFLWWFLRLYLLLMNWQFWGMPVGCFTKYSSITFFSNGLVLCWEYGLWGGRLYTGIVKVSLHYVQVNTIQMSQITVDAELGYWGCVLQAYRLWSDSVALSIMHIYFGRKLQPMLQERNVLLLPRLG